MPHYLFHRDDSIFPNPTKEGEKGGEGEMGGEGEKEIGERRRGGQRCSVGSGRNRPEYTLKPLRGGGLHNAH